MIRADERRNVPPATPNEGRAWIPTRGFRLPVAVGLLASAIVLMGGILILYFTELRQPSLPIGDLLLPIVVIVAFACILPLFTVLRRPIGVELEGDGVTLDYPLKKVSVSWGELMKIQQVSHGIVIFRRLHDPRTEFGGAYWVSLEQARAILADPRCPPVDMPETLRRAIFQS